MFKGSSYKTTIGGAFASTGVLLMGATQFDWMPPNYKFYCMLAGFGMMATGTFFTGLFARDNDKTSEQIGLNKDDTIKQ